MRHKGKKIYTGRCTRPATSYNNYLYKGDIVEKVPIDCKVVKEAYINGKPIGICVSRRVALTLRIIMIICFILLLIFIGFSVREWLRVKPESNGISLDNGDVDAVKERTFFDDIVLFRYNKYVATISGNLDIRIKNGDEPATVELDAAGAIADKLELKANEEVYYWPVTITTTEAIINGRIKYTCSGSTKSYDIVIENIDGPTGYSDNKFEDEEVTK